MDIDVSIVVPLFNEEENVVSLWSRLESALGDSELKFEYVFVDDGSSDGTLDELRSLLKQNSHWPIRIVALTRNFGQTPAMRAGIDHARGRILVTMDGDLQNDPLDIPHMVERIEQGADLVAGWRKDRKDALILRKVPSRVANWLIAKASGAPIHDTGCSLKAYRADLIREVPLYSDLHRFIPAMSARLTDRLEEVVVRHHARERGQSKYGISRVGKVYFDLMTVRMLIASNLQPAHWFGKGAFWSFIAATLCGVISAWGWTRDQENNPLVMPTVTLLLLYLSVHLVLSALFGEFYLRASGASRGIHPMTTRSHLC